MVLGIRNFRRLDQDFNRSEGDKLDFSGFTDGAGNPITLTWSDTPGGAYKIWSDGSYVYADTNGGGDADLVIKVAGIGANDFVGVNHAPVADDEISSTNEDITLTVTAANGVLVGDVDSLDGDTLTVTSFIVAGDPIVHAAGTAAIIAGKGTLTIYANGGYKFRSRS